MDPFYLGAYWGSRRESSLRCGERLARCVARLGQVDEALESWFRRAASKAAAKTPVELDAESLGQLLAQGRNRRDVGGEVIEELGFSIGLWNRAKPAVGMSGTVGAHPAFPGMLNSFVLDFPPPEDDALRLYDPAVAEAIFQAVVEEWEPDWATWTSHALRNAQGAAPREPVVGWMTYLADPAVADLPGGSSLLSGSAISVGRDVTDAEERAVKEMRARLANVGALKPIP